VNEAGVPLDRIYFIPETVPCPHCGERLRAGTLLYEFAIDRTPTPCVWCGGAISLADVGRFVGRLDGVSMGDTSETP